MAEVFLSYASPDREVAQKIAAFLEQEGVSCWIAPRDVPPGMEYGAAIIQGIETSRALVLVLSEHSNDSHFVRKEVERAVSKTKPVLPVRIREINPSGSLEFFISSAQWVDAWRAPMEQHLATLVHTVRALSSGGPLPQSSKLAPPKPTKSRVPLFAALGVVVAVLAGAGVYAWSPWLPAWQRSPAAFIEGAWCQPMTGTAFMRAEYKRSGSDTVDGEISFSNSTDIIPFRARVTPIADGIEYIFLHPPSWVQSGPARDKVLDPSSKVQVFSDGKADDLPPQTRCPPRTTG